MRSSDWEYTAPLQHGMASQMRCQCICTVRARIQYGLYSFSISNISSGVPPLTWCGRKNWRRPEHGGMRKWSPRGRNSSAFWNARSKQASFFFSYSICLSFSLMWKMRMELPDYMTTGRPTDKDLPVVSRVMFGNIPNETYSSSSTRFCWSIGLRDLWLQLKTRVSNLENRW